LKKAFTLIEIIISIFLFSIVMLFLYKTTSNLRLSNKNLKQNYNKNSNLNKTIYLLKNDIISTSSIKIKNEKQKLTLKTTSSIHNNTNPTVIWKLLKNNSLIRVENGFVDKTDIKLNKIRFYKSSKGKFLIFLEISTNKKIIAEVITRE